MRISFRAKTILGIAAIEAALLLLLVGSGLRFMHGTDEQDLVKYAGTAARLFATITQDAVLTTDLAALESFVAEVLKNPGILYARVRDAEGRVLAQGGEPAALGRPFSADREVDEVGDDVFDTFAEIEAGGVVYGRVEIGVPTAPVYAALGNAARKSLAIAAVEMGLVALFSFMLGTYLTRQLHDLRLAARRVSEGDLDHEIALRGHDELALTAATFNRMSRRLRRSHARLREREEEIGRLNAELEQRVAQRTAELARANAELQQMTASLASRSAQQQTHQMVLVGLVMSKQFYGGNLNDAACEITQTVVEALGVARAGIWLLDHASGHLRCHDQYTLANQQHRRGEQWPLAAHPELLALLQAGRVLAVERAAADPRCAQLLRDRAIEGQTALRAVPLYFGGTLHGVLLCEHLAGPRQWTIEEETFLAGIAGMVPLALESDARRETEQSLRQAETEARGYAAELAARVEQLGRANAELKELNARFEATQTQLLQSEKMAAIGQLAAGVAHEINNPVGYINSNIGSLKQYVDDLFKVLAAYEELPGAGADGNGAAEKVQRIREAVELDFLRQDIPDLLRECEEGVSRVKQIVQDLKDFSRVDEAEWQWTDLHRGLDSTLNVAWNELKYKAEVVKDYGTLPQVECVPSQLNQVFLNLLVNAAHAIESRGTITLRSGVEQDEVFVEVSDTGKGIAPEHKNRIFEPFFTTKPVGKGTGLGLSLAYGIVQKHGGRIEVESEVGKGTTFRVWVPVRQAESRVGGRESGGSSLPLKG